MQNICLENLLLIDIETVSQFPSFDQLTEQWKTLWQEKVKNVLPENLHANVFYAQRAAVMAEFAKVVCISIGYFKFDNNVQSLRLKSFYNDDEKILLQDFLTTINQLHTSNNNWCFTGHNIKEFDIPFICRRLLINNLSIPLCLNFQNTKPWETNIIDTFQYWRFGDYKNYTSLKLLAAALNLPLAKDDIDGSMVGDVYWKQKDLQRIVRYCQKDVVTTANIILRFKNMPSIKEEQLVIAT